MSDLDKWKEFLSSYGVEFTQHAYDPGFGALVQRPSIQLHVEFTGFFLYIMFDYEGNFVKVGSFKSKGINSP